MEKSPRKKSVKFKYLDRQTFLKICNLHIVVCRSTLLRVVVHSFSDNVMMQFIVNKTMSALKNWHQLVNFNALHQTPAQTGAKINWRNQSTLMKGLSPKRLTVFKVSKHSNIHFTIFYQCHMKVKSNLSSRTPP